MPDHNMTQKPAVSTDGIVPLAGDITAIVFTGIQPSLRPRHIATKYLSIGMSNILSIFIIFIFGTLLFLVRD